MIFNVNYTFFNKMRQIQFANQVKKQKKQNIRKKKKILHNLDRTSESEITKVSWLSWVFT